MLDFRGSKMKRWATGIGATPQTYMFALAAIFILGFLLYARWAVNQLKEYERTTSEIFTKAHVFAASKLMVDEDEEVDFIFDEVIKRVLFPIIVTDVRDSLIIWKGTNIDTTQSKEQIERRLRKLTKKLDKEHTPIPVIISFHDRGKITPKSMPVIETKEGLLMGYFHYGESSMINRLTWMPYVQILGIGFLGLIGWLGFRSIKNSEQQHIWVGIAKETAHQLGTPISSLLGWLELIKAHLGENGGRKNREMARKLSQIVVEMESDTQRLSKIASRFSQIGSIPELRSESISNIVAETIRYFNKRLPHLGRDIQISEHYGNVPDILVNRELLGWAFENLFKNAVDAIDHKGGLIVVSVRKSSDGEFVNVYVTDNGRGMDQKRKRMIFRPGYTTKGRGWGLGLNFVKRIVEGYHGGKVVVQESAPKEGTTIKVMLPVREEKEQREGSEEDRALSLEAASQAEAVTQS